MRRLPETSADVVSDELTPATVTVTTPPATSVLASTSRPFSRTAVPLNRATFSMVSDPTGATGSGPLPDADCVGTVVVVLLAKVVVVGTPAPRGMDVGADADFGGREPASTAPGSVVTTGSNPPLMVVPDDASTVVVVAADGTDTRMLVTAPVVITTAALPEESSTENDDDARRVTTPLVPLPRDTVPVIVHRVDVACSTESIRAMFVSPKSVAVTVVQSIGSLPDNVNATVVPVTFADTAASVSTGGVTSAMVTTVDAGDPEEMEVRAFP